MLPARPARDKRLDALRGIMQLQIFASHVGGSWFGAWAIHAAWGLSDSSEQFVLFSGFGLGSLFAYRSAREGQGNAVADLLRRTMLLWRIHLIVFFAFAALVIWADRARLLPGEIAALGWTWMAERPLAASLAAPTMLYQPKFMDILPVFVWCMLALPVFMAIAERSAAVALSLSGVIYAAGLWGGLALPGLGGGPVALNPFTWQMLFVIGALAGRRVLFTGTALPRARWVLPLALAVLALGFWIRLGWHGALPEALVLPVAKSLAVFGKQDLALPRIVHALALAAAVARLTARDGVFARPILAPLRAAGRHSLEVFCVGLFLSWGGTALLRRAGGGVVVDAATIACGIALLLAFAMWKERGLAPALSAPPARR
jgi:hypothetical protein